MGVLPVLTKKTPTTSFCALVGVFHNKRHVTDVAQSKGVSRYGIRQQLINDFKHTLSLCIPASTSPVPASTFIQNDTDSMHFMSKEALLTKHIRLVPICIRWVKK